MERFWKKVQKTESCWLWTGAKNDVGYGQIRSDGKLKYAHRFIFESTIGTIPYKYVLDHLCRVPACVNPDHLEAVTNKENLHRGLTGVLKQYCKRGHRYDGDNIYYRPDGTNYRSCRICKKEQYARQTL